MAKIEYIHPAEEDSPACTETIEVRAWDLGGMAQQRFYIGSGLNFKANGNIWLEIIYSVEGAQIFYTRNFLHYYSGQNKAGQLRLLEEIVQKGEGQFCFGDIMPDTSISLSAEKSTYKDPNGDEQSYTLCKLEISVDTGVVFGHTAPGERCVDIILKEIEVEDGVRFMRELVHEIDALFQGKHPDPASLPPGSSEWPFVWQLNRPAYNRIARSYREKYFENPVLTEAFDGWLAQLPAGSQILDTGCGHGEPVIARLLEKGFRVTGADFSPEMLQRAGQKFPQATFVHLPATQLAYEAKFDGACSFSSVLYLDPIDFYQAVYRLHCALKPDGLLFLYAMDTGPDWRGLPFHVVMSEWMWSWHYGMKEAARRLEEHGYFKVIKMKRVAFDAKEEQRVQEKIEKQKQEKEEYQRQRADHPEEFKLPYLGIPPERPGYAFVVVARRTER